MRVSAVAIRATLALASTLSSPIASHAQGAQQAAPISSATDEWDLVIKIAEAAPKAVGAAVDVWRNWRCTKVLSGNLKVARAERDSLARAQRLLAVYAGSKATLISDLEEYVLDPDTAQWRSLIVPQLQRVKQSAYELGQAMQNIPGSIASDTASAEAYLISMQTVSMKSVQLQRLEYMPAPTRANRASLRAVQKLTRLLQSELDALKMASVELGRHFGPGGLQPVGCPKATA